MKLTEKQELFAITYVMNGGDATNAYRENYNTKTDKDTTVYVSAWKLLQVPKVAQRVHELQMAKFSPNVLSIKERKEILSALSKKGDIKSIDLLNKMDGVYTANEGEKTSVTVVHYE